MLKDPQFLQEQFSQLLEHVSAKQVREPLLHGITLLCAWARSLIQGWQETYTPFSPRSTKAGAKPTDATCSRKTSHASCSRGLQESPPLDMNHKEVPLCMPRVDQVLFGASILVKAGTQSLLPTLLPEKSSCSEQVKWWSRCLHRSSLLVAGFPQCPPPTSKESSAVTGGTHGRKKTSAVARSDRGMPHRAAP